MRWIYISILWFAVTACPLAAQELSFMGGVMGAQTTHEFSYSWQLDYRYHFNDRFAWSASWINEGHTASHHRDGVAAQLWVTVFDQPRDFSLALGAGPYRFADTHFLAGDGYTNDHGWTPVLSLSATYYTDSPWFVRLIGNHVVKAAGMENNTLVLGVGYQLGWHHPEEDAAAKRERAANVFTLMTGRAIVNSRSSEHANAFVAEYRRALGRNYDWTVSWLNEGDPKILHREGAASQLWLVDAHLERKMGVGLGVGPYYCFERRSPPDAHTKTKDSVAALVSPTFLYRISSHWHARLTWNRVFSPHNRDADVIVAGVGYRWGTK